MENDELSSLICDLCNKNNEDATIICLIEEMSELTKVLIQRLRSSYKFTNSNLLKELAHVKLMAEVLRLQFDISTVELEKEEIRGLKIALRDESSVDWQKANPRLFKDYSGENMTPYREYTDEEIHGIPDPNQYRLELWKHWCGPDESKWPEYLRTPPSCYGRGPINAAFYNRQLKEAEEILRNNLLPPLDTFTANLDEYPGLKKMNIPDPNENDISPDAKYEDLKCPDTILIKSFEDLVWRHNGVGEPLAVATGKDGDVLNMRLTKAGVEFFKEKEDVVNGWDVETKGMTDQEAIAKLNDGDGISGPVVEELYVEALKAIEAFQEKKLSGETSLTDALLADLDPEEETTKPPFPPAEFIHKRIQQLLSEQEEEFK